MRFIGSHDVMDWGTYDNEETTMDFDINGNPDVMGSKVLSQSQIDTIMSLRLDFNALHQRMMGVPGVNPEAERLFAIARTQLEQACMTAVKAVSRT